MNHLVELDDCEMEIATQVAAWRVKRVMREGLGRGHGEAGVGFEDRHLPGAIAELALAKMMNLYWGGGMQDFGAFGDVGEYEVRGSFFPNAHCIVYATDRPDVRVVLVTIDGLRCTVRGFVRAGDAVRVPQYNEIAQRHSRKGSAESWWVPQSDLRSL